MSGEVSTSNSLADLAHRIKEEHGAAAASLGDAVRHAIAAGELLIEAKGQVPHGQWLLWLKDHCSLSERTCQFYMRLAKNRAEIEKTNAQSIADSDLTLNEAAALLALSSDVRKLLEFVKETEGLSGEELVKASLDAEVGMIRSPGYDPFHGRSEEEQREWLLFIVFLGKSWMSVESAESHIEWLLPRPFQNVAEWMGAEGEKCRKIWGMRPIPEAIAKAWPAFLIGHESSSRAEIIAELDALRAVQKKARIAAPPPRHVRTQRRRPPAHRRQGGGRE
jgi:Protein of unknown function (DUF3102)